MPYHRAGGLVSLRGYSKPHCVCVCVFGEVGYLLSRVSRRWKRWESKGESKDSMRLYRWTHFFIAHLSTSSAVVSEGVSRPNALYPHFNILRESVTFASLLLRAVDPSFALRGVVV